MKMNSLKQTVLIILGSVIAWIIFLIAFISFAISYSWSGGAFNTWTEVFAAFIVSTFLLSLVLTIKIFKPSYLYKTCYALFATTSLLLLGVLFIK
jgi:hypothetical protein